MTVQDALTNFYNVNGFDDAGGANKKIAYLKVAGVGVPIYNFKQRREQIWKHDLNHILTDYKTDWKGETAISGWEVATGGYGFNLVWLLIFGGFLIGVLVYPRITFRAFVRGQYSKSHVTVNTSREELLKMNLEELRTILGLNREQFPTKAIHVIKFGAITIVILGVIVASAYLFFLLISNFILS